jgi:hypothetical protein
MLESLGEVELPDDVEARMREYFEMAATSPTVDSACVSWMINTPGP